MKDFLTITKIPSAIKDSYISFCKAKQNTASIFKRKITNQEKYIYNILMYICLSLHKTLKSQGNNCKKNEIP